MVKLGLVTGVVAPRPSARPRTKVVLPAPTSPMSSTIVAPAGPVVISPDGSCRLFFPPNPLVWGSPRKAVTRPCHVIIDICFMR